MINKKDLKVYAERPAMEFIGWIIEKGMRSANGWNAEKLPDFSGSVYEIVGYEADGTPIKKEWSLSMLNKKLDEPETMTGNDIIALFRALKEKDIETFVRVIKVMAGEARQEILQLKLFIIF